MHDFKDLRITPTYSPYPPYHTGPYMEEFFYNFYKKNKEDFDRTEITLIPIFWTNLYIAGVPDDIIQEYIDVLPKDKKYFTLCQFDDGIHHTLPKHTINFVAGGNKEGIPVPLICSPIPDSYIDKTLSKDIFCSFVGTCLNTDKYSCRLKLYEEYGQDNQFYFNEKRPWDRIVTRTQFEEFCNITQRSTFTLCPRGYGLQSFRIYEALQLNSIPVFVYNKPFFPFCDKINWNEFCVKIHESEIPSLKEKLQSYSEKEIMDMLKKGKEVYKQYFTMEGMSTQILEKLSNL